MTTWTVPVSGLSCERCAVTVREQLSAVDGVDSVEVEEHIGGVSQIALTGTEVVDDEVLQQALTHGGAFSLAR